METEKWIEVPQIIEVVRIEPENIKEIAEWCHGKVVPAIDSEYEYRIRFDKIFASDECGDYLGYFYANIGDYIYANEGVFDIIDEDSLYNYYKFKEVSEASDNNKIRDVTYYKSMRSNDSIIL